MPYVKCKICSKEFYTKPNFLKKGFGKYCSRKCSSTAIKTGHFVKCDTCNKAIWRTPKDIRSSKSGKYFCSKSCQTLWRNNYFSGIRHPNWKNGEHQEYRKFLIRSGRKICCNNCGINNERILVVHHLDKDRSNNEVDNLIWLCLNCHFLTHNHN